MQRQNKNMTERIKRDEMKRVHAFVQLAYDNDPRVIQHKKEQVDAKDAAKRAKEEAARAEAAKREAAAEAVRESERAKAAEADAAKAAEKEGAASAKREKEKQRSALKKARKELRALGEAGAWAARAADLELLAAALPVEQLTELHATLVGAANVGGVHGEAAGAEALAAVGAQLTAEVERVVGAQK